MKHGKLNIQGVVTAQQPITEANLNLNLTTLSLMRNLIQESFDRKAHDLSGDENMGNCWVDTFNDATGIDGGASEKYTHRTSPNYDVIVASGLELDLMEYASDGAAQAAYVTSGGAIYGSDVLTGGTASSDSNTTNHEPVYGCDNSEGTYWHNDYTLPGWWKYDLGVAVTKTVRKLRMLSMASYAINAFKLQGSNNDSDWTDILSDTGANVGTWQDFTFANTTAYRYYRIYVTSVQASSAVIAYEFEMMEVTGYELQSYSENSIINQGTYSLKAIAAITDSLNDTLTKSGLSIDLTDKDTLKIDVRASRSGTNLQVQLRNGTESIDQEQPDTDDYCNFGEVAAGNGFYYQAQSFKLSSSKTITAIGQYFKGKTGNPAGNVYVTIETDDTGHPSGTLAHADATKTITFAGISEDAWKKVTFDSSFQLAANTTYWIVWRHDLDSVADNFFEMADESGDDNYTDGHAEQSYNSVPGWADRHNDKRFRVYTKELHTKDINITPADVFQEITWDISGIANADKDSIDAIIFKILNADSATTYYIDNFRVPAGDATLISIAQTADSAPDNILVMWEENLAGGTITFYTSRDGGSTWAEVTSPSNYTSPVGTTKYKNIDMTASGIGSGTSLKLKAIVTGDAELESWAMAWA